MMQTDAAQQGLEPPQEHTQEPQTVLVHIGKCGGATLRDALMKSDTRIDSIPHVQQPPLGARLISRSFDSHLGTITNSTGQNSQPAASRYSINRLR